MSFANNIRKLRRTTHTSQNQLADYLGYKSFTTIQKWEDGTAVPSYKTLNKLAEYFHVEVEALMSEDGLEASAINIPVLGIVRGGNPIEANQEVLGYERVNESTKDCFYLEVVGDSMKNARILPGDLLYVHAQSDIENGQIGVVMINNEATVKRVFFRNGGMVLQPENDDYQPIVLSAQDILEKNVSIVGKVLHNRIKY